MAQLELFTSNGVYAGVSPRLPLSDGGPSLDRPLALEEARWYPNDGTPAALHGSVTIAPDDILVVVLPRPEPMAHASWHALVLVAGPYRIAGRFESQPGFDPDRALARPSGAFVPIHDAVIELRDNPDAVAARRAFVQVNRFVVETVISRLTLAHHFPGASFVEAEVAPAGWGAS